MATAEDSPDGASVTCSLVDSSYFQLVGAEGEYGIIIAQSLPRHTSEQLQLPIQVLILNYLFMIFVASVQIHVRKEPKLKQQRYKKIKDIVYCSHAKGKRIIL
jgi:hypothetical protein